MHHARIDMHSPQNLFVAGGGSKPKEKFPGRVDEIDEGGNDGVIRVRFQERKLPFKSIPGNRISSIQAANVVEIIRKNKTQAVVHRARNSPVSLQPQERHWNAIPEQRRR
jgi:hypothetical protein